ncbi:hypothetical protein BG004_005240 [Podila humilis]|nr:hypothetical protein BG004_005240 [Podila humilis]
MHLASHFPPLPLEKSATARCFSILDLLEAIVANIDHTPSIVSCLQVSRHWFETCAPLLWRRISSSDWLLCLPRPISSGSSSSSSNPTNGTAQHCCRWSPGSLLATNGTKYRHFVHTLEYNTALVHHQRWSVPPATSSSYHSANINYNGNSRKDDVAVTKTKVEVLNAHTSGHEQCGRSKEGELATEEQTSTPHMPVLTKDGDEWLQRDHRFVLPVTTGLSSILCQCSNLLILQLHAETFANGDQGIRFETLEAIGSLRYLQDLELYLNNVIYTSSSTVFSTFSKIATRQLFIQQIIRPCTQLKRLALRGSAFKFQTLAATQDSSSKHQQYLSSSSSASLVPFTFSSLQQLSLDIPSGNLSELQLTFWLLQCPKLSALALPSGISWVWSNSFLRTMAEHCPRLVSFSISAIAMGAVVVPEDRLTALIQLVFGADCNGYRAPLKRFSARACHFGDNTLQALQAYAPHLEHLDMSHSRTRLHTAATAVLIDSDNPELSIPGLSTSRLLSYLSHSSSKNLKSLQADGIWIQHSELKDYVLKRQLRQQQQREGDTFVQDSLGWSCRDSLEHLVVSFSTPDATTSTVLAAPQPAPPVLAASNDGTNWLELSPPMLPEHLPVPPHWYIFNHLSTLTRLSHLHITHTFLDLSVATPASQREGGMYQLQSLKHLKTFSIESCNYPALTQAQTHWMMTMAHWPRLDTLIINSPGTSAERMIASWAAELGRQDQVQILSLQGQKMERYSTIISPPW